MANAMRAPDLRDSLFSVMGTYFSSVLLHDIWTFDGQGAGIGNASSFYGLSLGMVIEILSA
jgi:hypothetical protein